MIFYLFFFFYSCVFLFPYAVFLVVAMMEMYMFGISLVSSP